MEKTLAKAQHEIKTSAADAIKVVAEAAKEASAVIVTAAAAAAKVLVMEGHKNNEDHDMLVTLVEKVSGIKEDIKGIRDDHEERLRTVETRVTRIMTYGSAAVILLGIITFLINKYGK